MLQILKMEVFNWLKNSEEHLLLKSCIFHYEFEFISMSESGVKKVIKKLKDEKKLKRVGSLKSGHWELNLFYF